MVAASIVALRAAPGAAAFGVATAAGAAAKLRSGGCTGHAGPSRLRHHQQLRRLLHAAGSSRSASVAARAAEGGSGESKDAAESSKGQPPAPAPTPIADDNVEVEDPDDGRVLDTSSPAGFVGAVVVACALIPYMALGLYSSWNLATAGKAVEAVAVLGADSQWKLAPNGLMGLAEGLGLFIILGVLVWSFVSFVTRGGRGLPPGPLGLLGLAQNLAYVTALTWTLAYFLNGLPAEENPLRGLSFSSSKTDLESAASKAKRLTEKAEKEAAKLAEKEGQELAALSAGPRSQIDAALRTVQQETSKSLEKATAGISSNVAGVQAKVGSSVKVLDLKAPDLKLPDLKLPDLKAPDIKLPMTSASPEPPKESKGQQLAVPAQPTPKAATGTAPEDKSSSSSAAASKVEAASPPPGSSPAAGSKAKVPDFNDLFD
eukprot:TRINITY_DN47239_c0_g1_i1.p1 TRINITY_DN47239_c0_g1~~TRINITY_DN47239_c0_g1_i1.p1  ORF type:complete len:472 (+),score=119.23 TRINITY_DN47239_c0_g1_i1:125-1417(+)